VPEPQVSLSLVAYMGLGSGAEFLPYFVALLGVAGAALLAVVQRPVILLLRWLRRKPEPAPGSDAPSSSAPKGDAPQV